MENLSHDILNSHIIGLTTRNITDGDWKKVSREGGVVGVGGHIKVATQDSTSILSTFL